MELRDMRVVGRCFGTAVLGPRGQLVVPVEARKELGVDTGDKLLVFGHFGGRGLMFIKVEAVEELVNVMSTRLDEAAKLIKQSKAADAATAKAKNRSE
jgi:bifunctional DNA-binding transcriptional regulator/antitoxin component of YhaV-PrlF toxin-antitoxin module